MGKMIDFMIHPTLEVNFNLITAGLMVAFVVASSATFARSLLLGIASQRITMRLRSNLFESLISRDISFFDKKGTGELINRLSADTEVMSRALIENIARGLKRILEGVGGFVILIYLSPKLVMTMAVIVPPVFIGALYYGRMARSLATKVTDKFATATSYAEERLSSIRIVKLFNRTEHEAKAYSEHLMEVFNVAKRAVLYHSGFVSAVVFGINMSTLLILYQGANIVTAGGMTTGELASFLMYSMYIGAACSSLGNLYSEFVRALGSTHRVFSLIHDAECERAAKKAPKIFSFNSVDEPSFRGKITFENVSFSYPTRKHIPVLKNLNLTITPGTTTAVVGQSGCGKSTLALLCMRFYEPDEGNIYIDHTPIADIDPLALRQCISMVHQDTNLFSGTIAQNIAYGRPHATQAEIEDAARKAYVHEFLHSGLTYDTLIGPRGASLSGGQRQRIAIARVLIRNPKILILDEATSLLDVESEHLVQTALKRLMAGRTILCIAHRVSVIKNAHQVVVLDAGRVAESGTYQELMSSNGQLKKILQNV
ncbi:ATP-binding cassette sub-family B member 10, mitochondrial-like [Schistocerca gregaria]|uniref:ATP-binding cassette sub-family B member 10, mitochondrial-like n=1 Tax=Schistocerca gregaria TaxID=7010 RepID=UPI00211DCD80|nr:ATP-binding cassette sub-family B member 10, mitochondrial-like [Schistocerca gregaria]